MVVEEGKMVGLLEEEVTVEKENLPLIHQRDGLQGILHPGRN